MKTYTIGDLEACIYENQEDDRMGMSRRNGPKVNVLNFTQIDDKYVVVETDKDSGHGQWFMTCNMDRKTTISQVSYSRDYQILITLGLKYNGENNQFADYTSKMLNNLETNK